MDLEADLGIDTVKQAEVFATVRETFGIARQDNLKLRDYPTLRHVVGYVEQGRGGAPVAAPVAVAPVSVPVAVPVPVPVAAPVATVRCEGCRRATDRRLDRGRCGGAERRG